MAASSTKPMLLCVTFTAILSLCLVLSLAEFQRFVQPTKADGSLSFLVVGDWGRRGGYNQSQVAHQGCYLPERIHTNLDRISRNFLWGSTEEKRKIHMVGWKKVTIPKDRGGLGLHAAKERNLTLAAKLCWRMKNEGEKPWAKVLKHKYCRRMVTSKAPKSRTWAAIIKGATLCEKGMKWVIGHNSQLSFWADKWLDFGSLRSCVEGPLNKGEEELRVSDVQKDGIWDLHSVSFELPPLLVHSIRAIPIRIASRREDHICWISSSKGEFDAKNAYMLATGLNPNDPNNLVRKLDIDFVISTGDNFYDDGLTGVDDPAFDESFSNVYTAPSLQRQWYTVLGNHDYRGDVLAQLSPILRKFDSRWLCLRSFIVDAEIVEFFFVDTTPFSDKYFTNPEDDVYDWRGVLPRDQYLSNLLKELDLALKESTAKWKIVVGHHTIRSAGNHGNTVELVAQLLPILQANNVDFYINGHDHCLEHISSPDSALQFLTSGGGSKAWKGAIDWWNPTEMKFYYDGQGFMSVQITQAGVDIAFYDISGRVLHKWGTTKQLYSIT